uniref:RNA helicase n=1 Tax=Megaselia scalaris TaxID=36166 RepID=T1GMZ1_MEGSC
MSEDWAKKAEDQEISSMVKNLDLKKSENGVKKDDGSETSEEQPDYASPAEASLLLKMIRKTLVETKKTGLLKGVYAMGYNAPSKIQETALPTLLADPPQNMIAQSQSGTGKTAAFVLAMLSRVDTSLNYTQVLCISPTYELAIQTGEIAAKMAQFCQDIKLKYAVRGEEVPRGTKITEHIIIGTPGKIMDWGCKLKLFDLSKIRVFVLDEADVMIAQQGHHDQCIRIHKLLPKTCQMMFFSATYEKDVMEFAQYIVPNALSIRLKREQESLDNIKQYYIKCKNNDEKYTAVQNIYGGISIGQAILFCHTRKTANWLAGKMAQDGHAVGILNGDLTVEQRLAVLDRFRSGQQRVLVTTNVLSRGIDVEAVTIVVNFDLPLDQNGQADCETYLHRIGRTGRFGKNGIAINLVDSEKAMAVCKQIEKHFGRTIEFLDTDDADQVEKLGHFH